MVVVGLLALAFGLAQSNSRPSTVGQKESWVTAFWKGSAWLLAWGVISYLASGAYLDSTAGGGCDGGLCIMRFLMLPFIWLGVGFVLWLVKRMQLLEDEDK